MTTPSGTGLPAVIAAQVSRGSLMRVGRIVSFDSGYVSIAISGTSVLTQAAYLIGSYFPAVGDIVAVLNQGSQWIVLGEISSNPETNAVLNHSFEAGTLATPDNWTSHIPAGQSVDILAVGRQTVYGFALDGEYAGRIQIGFINDASAVATGIAYLISDPFPVQEGELWTLSCWSTVSQGTDFPDAETNFFAQMPVYALASETFPTDTPIGTLGSIGHGLNQEQLWVRVSTSYPTLWNGFPIPAGANWGRVVLSAAVTREATATSAVGINVYFDRIQAMRIN